MSILFAIYSEWALTALRVFVGALFMVHGWPKLKDIRGTAAWMGEAGFHPGMLFAPLVAALEFFGGMALLLGIFTRPVAALLALQFLVILVWRLATRHPFTAMDRAGWELDLVLLGAALVLMTAGGGALQLGAWLSLFLLR